MPIMVELDSEPTASEIEKARNGLANGKSPEIDSTALRSDQTRDTSRYSISYFSMNIYIYMKFYCLCLRGCEVSQDMPDEEVVTLFKNKDDCNEFNCYCGISLLSILDKVFIRVVLDRIQILAERICCQTKRLSIIASFNVNVPDTVSLMEK